MKHMGQDERNRIEFMLGCGNNVANIAKALGRSESTVRMMSEALTPAARQGQSVDAVIAGNPELFGGYARSTVYGWIEDGLFAAKKHDLPFAGTRRKPRKRPETKTCARCRVGRTYADLLEWLKANPGVVPTEADTVIGSVSGKVLSTFMVRRKLPLAFLRDAKTSQTFTRIVNMLWNAAGDAAPVPARAEVPEGGGQGSAQEERSGRTEEHEYGKVK